MVHFRRPRLDPALAEATQSAFTTPFVVARPWRALVSFLLLAPLLVIGMLIVVGITIYLVPGLHDQLGNMGTLPESPLRLIDESFQTVEIGLILAAPAFGILWAAALAWRRPLQEFLWPGRRFNLAHLGLGFLSMACISVVWVPIHLALGSEWAPPVLDAHYLDRTRLTYVLAMIVGLLLAAAAEEVVFRGVLLRLSGLIMRHPLLLCLINGVVFSAIHLDPDPVAFVARAINGVVWTWAALRLGGLEFAVGAHLANNLAIALFWQLLSETGTSRDSAWTDLVPGLTTAVVMVIVIEQLARRSVHRPPGDLPARAAA